MAIKNFDAESLSNGTVLTTANSGFTAVTATTASNTHVAHGVMGVQCQSGSSMRCAITGVGKISARVIANATWTTNEVDVMRLTYNPGTEANATTARITSARNLRLVGAGGATLWTSTVTMPDGEVEIKLYAEAGTSSTTGKAQLAAFVKDTTTPITGLDSGMLTAVNIADSTASLLNFRAGQVGGTLPTAGLWMDDITLYTDADATGFVPPAIASNTPPTSNAGTNQVNIEPGALVTVGGLDTDSDGTIVNYAWSQLSGPSVVLSSTTTSTTTFTAPPGVGSTVVLQKVVTDNLGATGTSTVSVTILPAARWTKVNGSMVAVYRIGIKS